MAHYTYSGDPAEPWWDAVPDSSDRLRYDRACRLSAWRRAIARGPSTMRSARTLARYQARIDRWWDYLHGEMHENA